VTVATDRRDAPVAYAGEGLDGKPLAIQDFRGRPVVVTVWGAWCSFCRKEAPWVAGATRELGDRVQFVGIDLRDSGKPQAQAFERTFGYDFPSFWEPDGEAMLAFPGVLGPRSIPSTVVLDAEGRVAASIVGTLPSQQTLVDVTKDVLSETRDG
jgi:thiol-disulfide isomerase/thioredoxin